MVKRLKVTRLQFERMLGGVWEPKASNRYRTNGVWITEVNRKNKVLIHVKSHRKYRARTWQQIKRMVQPDVVNKGEKQSE